MLETLRTLFVWLLDLLLFYAGPSGGGGGAHIGEPWGPFGWLEAVGFGVLVAGTLVYAHGDQRQEAQLQARARWARVGNPALAAVAAMATTGCNGCVLARECLGAWLRHSTPLIPVHAAAAVAPPNTAAIAALTSPAHSLPLAAASPAVVLPQLRESLSDLLTPAEARRPMRSPRIAGPSRIRTAYLQVGPCRKGWTPLFFPHAYRHMRWLAAQVLVPALGHAPSLATLQPARPAAALPLAFCPAAASPFAVCPALSPASHPLHPSP